MRAAYDRHAIRLRDHVKAVAAGREILALHFYRVRDLEDGVLIRTGAPGSRLAVAEPEVG